MAFNFFGTFTIAQWEAFKAFTAIQEYDLEARKDWLEKQLNNNGKFTTTYDSDNLPVKFFATGYAGKLLEAYRILGGYPEREMLLRTRDKPVYLVRDEVERRNSSNTVTGGYGDTYSNGRRWRGNMRFDRDLGLIVEKIKDTQLESIKLKRERLEFKIKAALDYSDQLEQEIVQINVAITELQFWVDLVEVNMESHVTDGDEFGLSIGEVADYTDENAGDEIASKNQRTLSRSGSV
jgi:hypothetical protein